MEIKKGSINLKETRGKMSAGNLVSGDVVISDTMPDIEEVVVADAKARICDQALLILLYFINPKREVN